jgi:hypothetical protein
MDQARMKHTSRKGVLSLVSFSKSIAVIASLTTIAVAAVTAVRYFDGMDSQIKNQKLLIEKLQNELKGGENKPEDQSSQDGSNPRQPAPASSSPADSTPLAPSTVTEPSTPVMPAQ